VQYLHHNEAGQSSLILTGDKHRYLFKVRRHREGETIPLRNLINQKIYFYRISSIHKKESHLLLEKSETLIVEAKRTLHIAWCIIDPKSIEKVLPMLNEIGVETITFIYCSRSQKSFKIDFQRLEKILINSSQQSGRSRIMKLKESPSLELFLKENPQTFLLDFSEQTMDKSHSIETILVGCEGGFTQIERENFNSNKIIGLDTPLTLKSESAVSSVAIKILL